MQPARPTCYGMLTTPLLLFMPYSQVIVSSLSSRQYHVYANTTSYVQILAAKLFIAPYVERYLIFSIITVYRKLDTCRILIPISSSQVIHGLLEQMLDYH